MIDEQKLLFDILKASLWGGKITEPVPASVMRELQAQTVDGLALAALPGTGNAKYIWVSGFVQMAAVQTETLKTLSCVGIPAVVIKGTATGKDYPTPYLRRYGDIDVLVRPENYTLAIDALEKGGIKRVGEIGKAETSLTRNGQLIEMHRCPPGLDRVKQGPEILDFLLSGLDDIQLVQIPQPRCEFPMLPWKQHGLELIWHIREHMYNGIGLRHIVDWMMFANRYLRDRNTFDEFREVLEMSGLFRLAQAVTKMCQMYLGLAGEFDWCADVDEATCEELMEYILEQGNFGFKRPEDKAAKVLTRYRNPIRFLKGMQQRGLYDWAAARRHLALRPFAWMYTGVTGLKHYVLDKNGRKRLKEGICKQSKRQELFKRLYDGD